MKETILESFFYLIILGVATNLFVEILKTKIKGDILLIIAWLVGTLVCYFSNFAFLFRIELIQNPNSIFDYVMSGFLCANVSRFLHKFYEYFKLIKEER